MSGQLCALSLSHYEFRKEWFLILDEAFFTYSAFKVRRNTCGDGEPINVIGDVLVENVSKPLP